MTYYHASMTQFDEFRGVVCVTTDAEAAIGYLEGEAGHLYTVEIAAQIADEDEIMEAAAACGNDTYTYAWEVLECVPGVVERLQAWGYGAAAYTDLGPDNAYEHETIMVFAAADVAVAGREEVDECSE